MIDKLDAIFASTKKNGLRKMLWGLIALENIALLALLGKLDPANFSMCFLALVAAVMGANAYEHKGKKEPNANPL